MAKRKTTRTRAKKTQTMTLGDKARLVIKAHDDGDPKAGFLVGVLVVRFKTTRDKVMKLIKELAEGE